VVGAADVVIPRAPGEALGEADAAVPLVEAAEVSTPVASDASRAVNEREFAWSRDDAAHSTPPDLVIGVERPFRGKCGAVAAHDGGVSPAAEAGEVAFLSSLGKPLVRKAVPERVPVDVLDAGLLAAAVEHRRGAFAVERPEPRDEHDGCRRRELVTRPDA
jgi:hypothetical protein